jgi:hypothetical protein
MRTKAKIENTEDLATWLTKVEASAELGVGTKTVDRMGIRGDIRRALRRRTGKAPLRVFHPADVAQLKAARSAPDYIPPPPRGTIRKRRNKRVGSDSETLRKLILVFDLLKKRSLDPAHDVPAPMILEQEANCNELAVCKRRGHDSVPSDRGWRRCRWCHAWVRTVTKIEEREDDPPDNERSLYEAIEELVKEARRSC